MTRLRIVPSQGHSWHVDDLAQAVAQAAAYVAERGTSVAVCLAPEGGLVTQVQLLQPPPKKKA